MKRNYFSLFAAATMMMAVTSCSQEEIAPQVNNEMATFEISLEGASQSRTAGDGLTAINLYYEVYQGTKTEPVIDATATLNGGKATIEMPLLRGEKYDIMFWAQKDGAIYNAENLKAIEVDYSAPTANNEDYDAFFYGKKDFQATANVTKIELRRPFAQLNIGTTKTDWETAISMIDGTNLPVTTSEVTVTGLANQFNVLTGEAEGSVEVTFLKNNLLFSAFDENGKPTDVEGFKATVNDVENDYRYLAMNYLLVPGTAASTSTDKASGTTDVTATFWRGEQLLFSIEKTNLANVPIQRNWRTNILGNLLADNKTFEIVVDPDFNDVDHNIPDTDEERLIMAAATGGEVVLNEDVTLTKPLTIQYDMTIDLNGHKISYTSNVMASSQMMTVKSGTTLTVKDATNNGKITYNYTGEGDPSFGWGTYTIYNSGKLVVDGGTIEMACNLNDGEAKHMYCAIQQINNVEASTIINGGKVSTPTYRSVRINSGTLTVNAGVLEGQVWIQPYSDNTAVTINGGSFEPKGVDGSSVFVTNDTKVVKLSVTGGTFATKIGASDFTKEGVKGSVSGGTFGEEPNENLLAEGYSAMEQDDLYVVGKPAADVSSLITLLNEASVVNITNAINNGTDYITVDGNDVVINMGGNEVKVADKSANYGFALIDSKVEVNDANVVGGGFNVSNSTLTFNSGNLNETFNTSSRYLFYVKNNSTVVINDGNFQINRTKVRCFYVTEGSSVVINGGNFASKAKSQTTDWFVPSSSVGTITIYGGTFEIDPTQWVADGYKAVYDSTTYKWIVTKQ